MRRDARLNRSLSRQYGRGAVNAKPRGRAQPLNVIIQPNNTVALTGGFDYAVRQRRSIANSAHCVAMIVEDWTLKGRLMLSHKKESCRGQFQGATLHPHAKARWTRQL